MFLLVELYVKVPEKDIPDDPEWLRSLHEAAEALALVHERVLVRPQLEVLPANVQGQRRQLVNLPTSGEAVHAVLGLVST